MKGIVVVFAAFVGCVLILASQQRASAAPVANPAGFTAVSAKSASVELKKDDDVKPPKDKDKKSKKNDGKDGDPDDGNAGKGNDGKKGPNDGPAND